MKTKPKSVNRQRYAIHDQSYSHSLMGDRMQHVAYKFKVKVLAISGKWAMVKGLQDEIPYVCKTKELKPVPKDW